MGKPTGFMDYERHDVINRDFHERVKDFDDMYVEIDDTERRKQGARCMDCGIPFCQSDFGCPVDNLIPEWNDLIRQNRWKDAYDRLRKTNNFPEYTGKICPAPCEDACVLAINQAPVTIKDNEYAIIERAYQEGWVRPNIPKTRTGKKIAIIGSGPAGLAAADQLNQKGHFVTIFERDDRIGGLLMYGIPNMKLDKHIVERRNKLMADEGVEFCPNTEIGKDISIGKLYKEYDAILLAVGATEPKDLSIPGRELEGIHFAMDYLHHVTKCYLDKTDTRPEFNMAGKQVVVIGSGDTGTDCIATASRQRAKGLVNFGWRDPPASNRQIEYPWPLIPKVMKFDYGHKEVAAVYGKDPREYNILTKEFIGKNGVLSGVKTVEARWHKDPLGKPHLEEVPNSEHIWDADTVLISLGYTGPEQKILQELNVKLTNDGLIDGSSNNGQTKNNSIYKTSVEGVYSAGDARRGQSLVVWAIHEGREAAEEIDEYIQKN